MVTVPASAAPTVTSVASVVGIGLGSAAGKVTAIVLALFFLFITVVYNYSFARPGLGGGNRGHAVRILDVADQ